jgi:hypothetical protein
MGSKKLSLEEKWHEQAEAFRREGEKLPYGKEREELLRKARQSDGVSYQRVGIVSRAFAADVRPLTVPEYRAYIIGDDGHFIDAAPLICGDDDAAVKQAEQLMNGRAIKLWSGERFIAKFEPKPE